MFRMAVFAIIIIIVVVVIIIVIIIISHTTWGVDMCLFDICEASSVRIT